MPGDLVAGYIGFFRPVSAAGGSGVWSIDEVYARRVGGYWPPVAVQATGGTITTYSSGGIDYTVHSFTASGTFTINKIPNALATMDVVVVPAAGTAGSGGGGGSGLLSTTFPMVPLYPAPSLPIAIPVTIGASPGGASIFGAPAVLGGPYTTPGGSNGAGNVAYKYVRNTGAGGPSGGPSPFSGGAGAPGYIFAGGYGGGGGGGGKGGAGGAGTPAPTSTGGAGGAGSPNSIQTGSSQTYGAGGAGGNAGGAGTAGSGPTVVIVRYVTVS